MAIADMLQGKLIEKAVDVVWSLFFRATSELSRIHNVEPELHKFAETRRRIEALLADAKQRRYIQDDNVHLWLDSLRSIAYEAEDLAQEFDALTALATSNNTSSRKRKRISFFDNKRLADSIQKLQKRYEEINRARKELRLRDGEATCRRVSPFTAPTSSICDELRVYGRETERDEIVGLLACDANCPDLRVFSIVGCGGIGKTTLARDVFGSDGATNFFRLKIWVGLSQEYDVVMATRKIIESVAQEECHLSSFDLMQRRLREIVTGKRFLIVLDNVCNEELDFWERLQAPLAGNGAVGSAVLVTTRSERVSRNMQAQSFWLQGLPFPHCWSMFLDRAFPSAERRRILEENPELERIGLDIVSKSQGLPMLVKLVGRLLYSEGDVDEWRCVRDEMLENEEASRDILQTLRVSYDHLPLHLKRCFAFCSVFPVGYEFDKDELVKLWVALGFIKPSGRREAEDIGAKYFTDLLGRSFFHYSCDSSHGKQMYKMPSVIRDLAKSVSKFECAGKDEVEPDKYKEARYIMLSGCSLEQKVLERVYENKHLRALMLHGEGGMLTGYFEQAISKA